MHPFNHNTSIPMGTCLLQERETMGVSIKLTPAPANPNLHIYATTIFNDCRQSSDLCSYYIDDFLDIHGGTSLYHHRRKPQPTTPIRPSHSTITSDHLIRPSHPTTSSDHLIRPSHPVQSSPAQLTPTKHPQAPKPRHASYESEDAGAGDVYARGSRDSPAESEPHQQCSSP